MFLKVWENVGVSILKTPIGHTCYNNPALPWWCGGHSQSRASWNEVICCKACRLVLPEIPEAAGIRVHSLNQAWGVTGHHFSPNFEAQRLLASLSVSVSLFPPFSTFSLQRLYSLHVFSFPEYYLEISLQSEGMATDICPYLKNLFFLRIFSII